MMRLYSPSNSTYGVIYNPVTFQDVEQHWVKDTINEMGSRMIVSGSGDGKFNPDKQVTRAEFAAMIVRGLGLKPKSGESIFSDVKTIDWYNNPIME